MRGVQVAFLSASLLPPPKPPVIAYGVRTWSEVGFWTCWSIACSSGVLVQAYCCGCVCLAVVSRCCGLWGPEGGHWGQEHSFDGEGRRCQFVCRFISSHASPPPLRLPMLSQIICIPFYSLQHCFLTLISPIKVLPLPVRPIETLKTDTSVWLGGRRRGDGG